jgi:hypothetical protein
MQHDTEAISVVRDVPVCTFMKEARKMAWACARTFCQRLKPPVSRGIAGDGVLRTMKRRMDMVAAFEPRRELGVASGAADIDHQMACNFVRTAMVCNLAEYVQHQVYPGGNARAAVATAVFNEEPAFKHLCIRSSRSELRAS